MIGIEIFSGAGGMSLGATMAGIDVKLAIEIDKAAAATFAYNHKNATVLNSDIREIKTINIKSDKQQKILFGGPPCQGFSRSNKRTRNEDNPNNWLFEEYIRITKLWKPNWVVLENVEGILTTEDGIFVDNILRKLKKLGYTTNYKVLNAHHYGVPQNRERLFIVGSLDGTSFEFPDSTHTKALTVKQALYDLPSLPNGNTIEILPYKSKRCSKYAEELRGKLETTNNHGVTKNQKFVTDRYKYIPQGGNWQDIPKKLMKNYTDSSRCHSGIYHRLSENEPSVVIGNYRKNMLIHPLEDRGLSVREAARLQSFPDWFEFKGFLGDQQQQVGNAVPPKLSKAIFDQIYKIGL